MLAPPISDWPGGALRLQMIDPYASETSNGWKVSITLEELALPCTVHPPALSGDEQKAPRYLKINPNGRIPVVVDRDSDDFAVFEAGAIMACLMEKPGGLMPRDARADPSSSSG